jgi:protein involved in polysaccharide export with SLBB domain
MSVMTSRRSHPLYRVLMAMLLLSLLAESSHGQGPIDREVEDVQTYRPLIGRGADLEGDALPVKPVIRQWDGRLDELPASTPGRLGAPKLGTQPAFEVPAKSLPPNDFQRFVLENSGQALPLFGSSFFSQPAQSQPQSTFTPQANAPVSPDYRIGPGDELQIHGWGSVDIDVRVTVDRNGQIHIPRIGSVSLNGVRSGQAEDVIRSAVARYYRDFQLSVTLGQLKGVTIYVVGQARRPGAYNLSSASTLVSALFATGGPSSTGSMRRVQVKRADKVVTELDMYAFLSRGDKSADIRLQDGDTIVIPAAKGYIALSGKVSLPAVYELRGDNEALESILSMAGGLPVVADPTRVQLERIDPSRRPPRSVEIFALDGRGLNTPLRSGDILTVSSVVPDFNNIVTLRGNVAEPIRSPWQPGMKIGDLIPNRSFLMSRASVKRQNEVLLSDEEKQRVQSGSFDIEPVAKERKKIGDSVETLAQRIGNLIDEVNFEYAVIERVDSQNLQVKLLPFNLGQVLKDPSSQENLPLQPGDIVTVFSVNDVRVPHAKRQVYVRVEGEVMRPGIYQMVPGETLPQLLDKAGGLTPDAYLFGAGFYREEVRKAQIDNLSQLVRRLEMQMQTKLSQSASNVSVNADAGTAQLRLQTEAQAQKQAVERLRNLKPTGRIMLSLDPDYAVPDKLPGLRLENQDRFVVPSKPDFVYVLGAVNTESSLIYEFDRSVGHYLSQSGLTSGADVDEIFVVRQDGSVLSDHGRWFSSVTRATVHPGDIIVLPEKTDHESAWSIFTRNAKDITQIIYQFSLGAAAIKTLRE